MNEDILPLHIVELRERTKRFPKKPGVYLMRDEAGEIIYIGKALELKNRVRNYLFSGDGRVQITYLVQRLRDIEVIVTPSEEEAFVLERDLIQRYKPRYNIRLKDDKAFYNVRIDKNDPWPRIELVRKVQQDGALYFGPFTYNANLRGLLDVIRHVVPLRTCANTVFFNRARPCLEYQIKRCAGPCCLEVDKKMYEGWVDQAISLLGGNIEETKKSLEHGMESASAALNFEEAAAIRDRLAILENYASGTIAPQHLGEGRDVFAIYRDSSLAAACVLIVRAGRIVDTKQYTFTDISVSDGEFLEGIISQFYPDGGRDIPQEIVVSHSFENLVLIEKTLNSRTDLPTHIHIPEEGSAARLLEMALVNAKQAYVSQFEQEGRYSEVASELALKFNLKQVPRRIEAVDISNFQGTDVVGAVVCFVDGMPAKEHYRRYNISKQGVQDDFASIYEVVHRRLTDSEENLPDLLVIDGGEAQLNMAIKAKEIAKVDIDIISLAKSRTEASFGSDEISKTDERVFLPGIKEPVILTHPEVFRLLTRLRDEVHRFVITFHRQKRTKRIIKSALDGISGVGPERRQRLLKYFGSIEAIVQAPVEDIAKAGRMPKSLAEKIKKGLTSGHL